MGERALAAPIWLGALGVSFWFVVGVAFGHHNESYMWAVHLQKPLWTVVSNPADLAPTYRPLGVGVAWLTYRLSGGSLVPMQLFNYLVAAGAWVALCATAREPRLTAVLAAVVGGVFFSGYLYLFHIQGYGYSPVLWLVPACVLAGERDTGSGAPLWLALAASLLALFHPFALVLALAGVTGRMVARHRDASIREWMATAAALVVLLTVLRNLGGATASLPTEETVRGWLTSYRTAQVNAAGALMAGALAVLTAAGAPATAPRVRAAWAACALGGCVACWLAGVPTLLAWVAACAVKMVRMRQWSVAALVAATSVLPLPTGTGSPTYTIFVLMICTRAAAFGNTDWDRALAVLTPRRAAAIVAAAGIAAVALRMGVHVPVLSTAARPLLAEREKTFQLEQIIDWYLEQPERPGSLELHRGAPFPVRSEGAIDRTYRPPTQQEYLDTYLAWRDGRPPRRDEARLAVSFGGEAVPGAELLFRVPGHYAGSATVYRLAP